MNHLTTDRTQDVRHLSDTCHVAGHRAPNPPQINTSARPRVRHLPSLVILTLLSCFTLQASAQRLSEIHLKYDDGSEQVVPVSASTPAAPSQAAPTTAATADTTANIPPALTPFHASISQAGLATFFNAVGANPSGTDPTSFIWTWDFGDPNSPDNQMHGFNVAHIYEQPGTYTITLTLSKELSVAGDQLPEQKPVTGNWQLATTITIPPSTRRIFNVPPGADLSFYTGQSNIELILSRGVYSARRTIVFNNNVLLRGNDATLNLVAPVDGFVLGTNCRVTGLTIDYPAAAHPPAANFNGVATAFYPSKSNIAIDHCTFLNVAYCVNGNRKPDGVLIQHCSAPLIDGLRGYLAWVQGKQWVINANTVKNPIIEHCIRCEDDAGPLSITNNTLSNLSTTQSGVKDDWSKGCILLHWTHDAYLFANSITGQSVNGGGDVGVGPLRYNGNPHNPERVLRTIVADNTFHSANLGVDAGAADVRITANQFRADQDWPINSAIVIHAADTQRARDVRNVTIQNNTADPKYTPLTIMDGQVQSLTSDWRPK